MVEVLEMFVVLGSSSKKVSKKRTHHPLGFIADSSPPTTVVRLLLYPSQDGKWFVRLLALVNTPKAVLVALVFTTFKTPQ
jgi:hypothetical protein